MNKIECTATAARCRAAAAQATERAAVLAVTFGGTDALTLRAVTEATAANTAATEWDKLAAMHPQSRAKLFRNTSLPSAIFGY